jgi:hypothetical protein
MRKCHSRRRRTTRSSAHQVQERRIVVSTLRELANTRFIFVGYEPTFRICSTSPSFVWRRAAPGHGDFDVRRTAASAPAMQASDELQACPAVIVIFSRSIQ